MHYKKQPKTPENAHCVQIACKRADLLKMCTRASGWLFLNDKLFSQKDDSIFCQKFIPKSPTTSPIKLQFRVYKSINQTSFVFHGFSRLNIQEWVFLLENA